MVNFYWHKCKAVIDKKIHVVLLIRHVSQLFTTQSRLFTTLKKKPFENIVGKGENSSNQHFLNFPQCFLPIQNEYLLLIYIYFVLCKCFEFGTVLEFVW